ncbi:MAG: hypothetical protein R2795_02785 [Saprospiraceae bacterium]
MKMLLVAATDKEIMPCITTYHLANQFQGGIAHTRIGSHQVSILITGVGLPATAFALGAHLARHRYDLLIQAGIAGAIDPQLHVGDVVEVVSDCFADLGVEEADGVLPPPLRWG